MKSYSAQKYLESRVSGVRYPTTASTRSLSALKYMNDMTQIIEEAKDPDMAKIATESSKYGSAAIHSLANNVGLQNKYGSDEKGVETLESQLKEYQSKRVFESVLDDVLDQADAENKPNQQKFNVADTKLRNGLTTK